MTLYRRNKSGGDSSARTDFNVTPGRFRSTPGKGIESNMYQMCEVDVAIEDWVFE